jgi:hypothetical protein
MIVHATVKLRSGGEVMLSVNGVGWADIKAIRPRSRLLQPS